jgi:hypothetical protein
MKEETWQPYPSSAFSVRSASRGAGKYAATSANGVSRAHNLSPSRRR